MATAIIQARMGSSRLPGKVLKQICGKPILYYILTTLRRSLVIDRIVIATSTNRENDPIQDYANSEQISVYRGDEENVLKRFYEASIQYPDQYYFRVTADNPIFDYTNPDKTLMFLQENDLDYACGQGYPIGAVVECFTGEILHDTYRNATDKSDLEHVTLFMKRSGKYRTGFFHAEAENHFPDLRLTVDYPEDFKRADLIIRNLYQDGIPDIQTIISFMRQRIE